MHERLESKGFVVTTADYAQLHVEFDDSSLQRAYVGRWPDRQAFGAELLADTKAAQHLAALPRWLRDYVTLDTERFVHDMEHSGEFVIRDVSSGIAVFDGMRLGR